ncbi:MAG: serine hydrolase domain-containing protein [Planctomycetota bacterium]
MYRYKITLYIMFLGFLIGCGGSSSVRETLTYEGLVNGFNYKSPVDESALTIPVEAASPKNVFEGRLELVGESHTGEIKRHRGGSSVAQNLPEFDFEYVQQDGYLIPVQRGLIITDHETWNYHLEPGRVWYEPGDGAYSRASLPFALSRKGSSGIYNGTMTFVFNDDEISKVWYQVTQETDINSRVDLWGLLDARYKRGMVDGSEEVRNAFSQELADRFPTKPIEALVEDYPDVDISAFGQGVSPEAMTWYGFVVNGINYVGGCETRYGIYPYCEWMRAPSYSTAKSTFASVALMRLAQKYDQDVENYLIKDYVPEAADSIGDWSMVTFDHALDMATGNYRTSERMVDEENRSTDPFWFEDYYDEIMAAAFNWPHSASPGTVWVYRTSDTFIVTRAMQNYLQTQAGPDADIFDFVVEEVYKPLKMEPGVFVTLRTKDNNWQGQSLGGSGLWWISDDLAKLTTFLNVDHGMVDGVQILQPDLLDDALQRDPLDRGVDRDGYGKYNNAFWADKYTPKNGSSCEFWVPHMYGYSGIVVALMPNGTAYYYASDNRDFTSTAAIQESDVIISMCSE